MWKWIRTNKIEALLMVILIIGWSIALFKVYHQPSVDNISIGIALTLPYFVYRLVLWIIP